jgi:MATE family multidrug resistance protein
MSELAIAQPAASRLWWDEARATLALSWPMVLTNLVQTAMTATDVVMLGWLGPDALAAGALGTNLYFAFLIFGIGLVSAVAPMIAKELGRQPAFRSRRAPDRSAGSVERGRNVDPHLGDRLERRMDPGPFAWPGPGARCERRRVSPNLAMVAAAVLGYLCAALVHCRLERPVWGLWIGLFAWLVNAGPPWCLIFWQAGFPRLELVGAGDRNDDRQHGDVHRARARPGAWIESSGRYRIFGRFWRADWPRFPADVAARACLSRRRWSLRSRSSTQPCS